MNVVVEYILLGVGLLLTCIVVNYACSLKDTGTVLASEVNNDIVSVTAAMSDSKVSKYNGLLVSGADVTNVIRRFPEDGVRVVVETKNQSIDPNDNSKLLVDDLTNTYANSKFEELDENGWKDYTKLPQIGDKEYINPSADFQCTVTTDTSSGSVRVMTFTQTEATNVAKAVQNTVVDGNGDNNNGNGNVGQLEIGDDSLASLNTALSTVATSLQTVSAQLATILNNNGNGNPPVDQTGSITKSLSDMQDSINQLSTDMKTSDTRIETKVNTISNTVNTIQSAVNAMQKSINSLTIAVNNADVSSTDISQLKESIKTLQDTVTVLQGSVNSNTTAVKQIKNATLNSDNSDSLVSRLNNVDLSIEDISRKLATLTEKVRVLESQVGTGG